jgi:hypothetical protein
MRYLYLEGTNDRQEYIEGNTELLRGTIPKEISTLTQLVILDLNFNFLVGEVGAKRLDFCFEIIITITSC